MTRLWLVAVLMSTPLAQAADSVVTLDVPFAEGIVIDGRVDEDAWSQGLAVDLEGGGSVQVLHDHGYLYVGITGQGHGLAHVYVSSPEHVYVLHASAALGAAVYELHDGSWTAVQHFDWQVRDTSMSPEAQDQRRAYLAEHGWVASTGGMGTRGEIEYQIHLELADRSPFPLAVVFAARPVNAQYWPESLADDTRDPQLVSGEAPEVATFDVATWAQARPQGKKEQPAE